MVPPGRKVLKTRVSFLRVFKKGGRKTLLDGVPKLTGAEGIC